MNATAQATPAARARRNLNRTVAGILLNGQVTIDRGYELWAASKVAELERLPADATDSQIVAALVNEPWMVGHFFATLANPNPGVSRNSRISLRNYRAAFAVVHNIAREI